MIVSAYQVGLEYAWYVPVSVELYAILFFLCIGLACAIQFGKYSSELRERSYDLDSQPRRLDFGFISYVPLRSATGEFSVRVYVNDSLESECYSPSAGVWKDSITNIDCTPDEVKVFEQVLTPEMREAPVQRYPS